MKPMTVTEKIIRDHLVEGEFKPGSDIVIRIDHTLTQDATGTMVYLEFEKLGLDRVRTDLSASYVDHNLLQVDYRNHDDHRFLQSAAKKWGVHFSRPGNGISHQVHLERFGEPGKTLMGSDSHTPTGAGISMLAIGAGGLDVALAMAGMPFYFKCPKVHGIHLTGKLSPWVSAKDVILEMLRRYDVKGAVGMVLEYFGPGVETLSASDRGTIGNMGTELGATSTMFPSDHRTKAFLEAQGRGQVWREIKADEGAEYDMVTELNLSEVEPMLACPSSPGNVKTVVEMAGLEVGQVITGSSVNSSYRDLMIVVKALEGKVVHENVEMDVNPGSRQSLMNVAEAGGVTTLSKAGVRIQQSGCLGCIGQGQAPGKGIVSLRTFPRNFPGRSGTDGDQVYLCSPETAVAAALTGKITDPRTLGAYPEVKDPDTFLTDDSNIIFPLPADEAAKVELVKGPNVVSLMDFDPLAQSLEGEILLSAPDNTTTDEIMPAGADVLKLRSNIPAISEFTFTRIDKDLPARAKEKGGGFILGGENYGQGSSREHAALAPRFLGIRAKIVKSYARIHKANLINFGILPLVFKDPADHAKIKVGAKVKMDDVRKHLEDGMQEFPITVDGAEIIVRCEVSAREREILIAGGKLNFVKNQLGKK
jgi:aconitate hydratase